MGSTGVKAGGNAFEGSDAEELFGLLREGCALKVLVNHFMGALAV